jgi:His/Glu/Gln/Arg/opine family amino acid ABC transporter permease subunit
MDYNWNIVFRNYELLIQGLAITVQVTLISVLIGFLIGGVVCAARLSKTNLIKNFAIGYILFFRATPEMILIFWAYFCVPMIFEFKVSGFWTGSVALGLVTAAYLAEIFRAGFNAIPVGQLEAADSLGLKFYVKWRFIITPQLMKIMIPPLFNYFTELLKNTSLLSGIGVAELALQAYLLGGQTFRYVEFLTAIAILYFLMIFPLSFISRKLELKGAN